MFGLTLFVSAVSIRLLFSSRHNNNTNWFKFSITYFIVVINTLDSLLKTIAHHALGLHLRNKLYITITNHQSIKLCKTVFRWIRNLLKLSHSLVHLYVMLCWQRCLVGMWAECSLWNNMILLLWKCKLVVCMHACVHTYYIASI